MKKIDSFTNKYSLSKTLRFKLIPVGETLKFFEQNRLLEEDENRARSYAEVKKLIDEYHRDYIDRSFSRFEKSADNDRFVHMVSDYSDLYYKSGKDGEDKEKMQRAEGAMREIIAKQLRSSDEYKAMFKEDMTEKLLPDFLVKRGDSAGLETVREFKGFSTYFTGFFSNRENMYSDEEKSTAIAFRCINDNLPRFLDNLKIIKGHAIILFDFLKRIDEDFSGIYGPDVGDVFEIYAYSSALSQKGIEKYNSIIGGYTCSDGTKIQGLNEYINLHNQSAEKSDRIPKLKQLYKQVLSKTGTISFIPEKFGSDAELLQTVKAFYESDESSGSVSISECVDKIRGLFDRLSDYLCEGIFVKNSLDLTTVSAGAFGFYGAVRKGWDREYDCEFEGKHRGKKNMESDDYFEKRNKAFKAVKSFSLSEIQKFGETAGDGESGKNVSEWLKTAVCESCENVVRTYKIAERLISEEYREAKKLYNNDEAIETIKDALDAVKTLENTLRLLTGTGKEEGKDENFYGEFVELYDRIRQIDGLYDKVRNYLTQKPYKTDKIKLNFQNPQFLGGWDRNKESDYSSVLLRNNDDYYLAVMPKGNRKSFESVPETKDGEDYYEKMIYKLLPGPNKMLPKVFFSKKGLNVYHPSTEIVEINKLGTYKSGDSSSLKDCHRLIDFYKNAIQVHPDWSRFGFSFSETSSYSNIGEFYNEIKNQGYKVSFCSVPSQYVDSLVSEGQLYLFRIFNKDFSENSRGTPNLHTLYFKMLFSEENLKKVVLKLNGKSEMFYRKASINKDEMIIHPKDVPVRNKNSSNDKPYSTFNYDLIKNRRYTADQFMLHIPITLNFTAEGKGSINPEVRKELKNCDSNYVIGIDRGERNLLYISVVDSNGRIAEQFSLNEIVNEYNGKKYETDYHALLEKREAERKESRESWKSIESIKELKEGYISQVVHKICQLVEKYDAVIAMEDLNFGFKRGRGKFEKSVYQKFEKMLIDKLNYLVVDKTKAPGEIGGVLNGYQLTNRFESFSKMNKQNGFIFYIPAYLTSKIDPVTGFADLLHPRYESVAASKDLIGRFDSISYNREQDLFEFALDYEKFPKCNADYRKKWTVCTYGSRIRTFRNVEKNNSWNNETVCLTDEFKKLFDKFDIDYQSDLKARILSQDSKDFYQRFISLLGLTLQMRNSLTGDTDVDYLVSPVRNASGGFFNSNDYKDDPDAKLPRDADANGAYNIARKVLWAIGRFKACEDDSKLGSVTLAMTNAEWLEYAQKQ